MSEKFTTEQLNELRTGYGTIKSIDPCQPTYARLVATLDGMSQEQLKQLRDERIPWLGRLAINRISQEG